MWPKWLAETLDRSALEARPHHIVAKPQRVGEVDDCIDHAVDVVDWDDVTGFEIHAGFDTGSHDV